MSGLNRIPWTSRSICSISPGLLWSARRWDEAFQKKCAGKIEEIRRAGKTFVYVSHALGTVRDLCERCLLLSDGKVISLEETDKVIADYMQKLLSNNSTQFNRSSCKPDHAIKGEGL
jgi:ABC-type sugar transport system ATPase subunit